MNLQKLILIRSGNRSVISKLLGKIEEVKEKSDKIEFNAILEALESKTNTLDALDEKILSQTGVEYTKELITTEEYKLELEIQLRKLRAYRQMNSQTDGHTTTSKITENHDGIRIIRGDDMRENFTDGANGGETGNHANVQLPRGNIQFAGSQNS
jgi:hypothetical protein